MAINRHPYPSRFIINEENSGSERYFSKKFTHEDLYILKGDALKDHTDLTQFAKNMYSTYSKTLSSQTTLSPIYDMLVGSGGKKQITDNFVRWKIFTTPDKRAISLGNTNRDDTCYGGGEIPFKVTLDVDWYGPLDVLVPLDNKRCQVVVQDEPRNIGGKYEYEVIVLQNPENATVFPVEYLREGSWFLKIGSLTSDLGSNDYGTLQMGFDYAYIEFEASMTTMAWKYFVDKEAHKKFGTIEMAKCDDDGRPIPATKSITNLLELEGMSQIDYEKELWLAYGTQTDFMVSKSNGNRITTGPGLFEFLEESNVIPYSPTANGLDRIASEIEALWFDRVAVQDRKLMLYTGHGGLKLFHDWIEQKYGNTAVVTPYDFVLGDAPAHSEGRKGYAYGKYQFTKYMLPIFGEIVVAHWAFLDNTRINTVKYPNSHFPVSSFEFYAFDIGFGEPNVQLLEDSTETNTTIIPGMWSPFGAVGPNNPVYKQPTNPDEWGYHWTHREKFGIVMMDPSRALCFKPNIVS